MLAAASVLAGAAALAASASGPGSAPERGPGDVAERQARVMAARGPGSVAERQSAGRTVLATGDSTIQIVDSFLARRLERRRGVRVVSDARISTGLSKSSVLNWPLHASGQMRRYRPRVTVVSIGANDGFPFRGRSGRSVGCCGRAWRLRYAQRARRMMRTYRRRGAGRVYWLLLPQARGGSFRRVFPAVNAALRRAARPRRDGVRLIHLNRVFTPRGRYHDVIRRHRRLVRVRQRDGVHLSIAGASIAASLTIRAIDRDHALRRRRR